MFSRTVHTRARGSALQKIVGSNPEIGCAKQRSRRRFPKLARVKDFGLALTNDAVENAAAAGPTPSRASQSARKRNYIFEKR